IDVPAARPCCAASVVSSSAWPNRNGIAADQTRTNCAAGTSMLAAVTATLRTGGGAVTLWDEIAPPRPPVPLPAGAPRPMQGSRISYLRR
ncbi:hypothetical protein PPH41_39300, partial [Burkholderia gladioli]|nr:hypothetical protein [Burkholderia gladioli]